MKRSEVNEILTQGMAFIRSSGFKLPPFSEWRPGEMQRRRGEIDQIVQSRLGWDITDYGRGHFNDLGLLLFTLRNGRFADLERGSGMLYAEKIMISRKNQLSPMHRHAIKAEDIINRGGGSLVIELFGSDPDGRPDLHAPVTVACDGIARTIVAGGRLQLSPGESVTLLPGVWHAFWAEKSDVLIGEVSTVNDDLTDNEFLEPVSRFSEIEEDVSPERLLVSDYPTWLN